LKFGSPVFSCISSSCGLTVMVSSPRSSLSQARQQIPADAKSLPIFLARAKQALQSEVSDPAEPILYVLAAAQKEQR
jgi:hypothetical protein